MTASSSLPPDDPAAIAARIIAAASDRGATLAVAESLTGGAVTQALVGVPGASAALRLGVVAYATEMKREVLGVSAKLLAERGAVDSEVAMQMALGAQRLASLPGAPCTIAVATTGVAGPEPQDGHSPGEFHIGLAFLTATGTVTDARIHHVGGDRAAVRRAAMIAALAAVEKAVRREDLAIHSESTS